MAVNATYLLGRIAAAQPEQAETIRAHDWAAREEPTPFYGEVRVLHVLVRLPYKVLEFHYADDGRTARVLASPEDVYAVNRREQLRLPASHVPAYLRFFFGLFARKGPAIVEAANEARWFPLLDDETELKDRRAASEALIHPARVSPLPRGGYEAVATAIEQRTLLELVLAVSGDGQVVVAQRRTLVEGIPVPYLGF